MVARMVLMLDSTLTYSYKSAISVSVPKTVRMYQHTNLGLCETSARYQLQFHLSNFLNKNWQISSRIRAIALLAST